VVRVRTAAVLVALAALLLTGCTAGRSGPAVASGDPARCPGRVLDVVVSVAQWGQVVGPLTGPCATVTTVISSAAIDPHEYEPTTGDIAAFQEADLVVLDGAGYDSWAAAAVADLDPGPARVVAAQVAGGTDPDPHLWYSPAVVHRMAAAVTARLSALAPADAAVFAGRAAAFHADLAAYDRAVAALRPLAAGHSYAATEPVFDRMAHAVGLTDATPAGYRRAVSNESDPAPADVAALEAALAGRRIDVLIFNRQTAGAIPDQLRAAARRAGIPVVQVTESPPQGSGSFVAWQTAQLADLTNALERAR
jgi:zinc/manganese transport system substrate-binding protein